MKERKKKMKYNFENSTIDMTKAEAKLAATRNTSQFKELIEMRKEFPDFAIYVIPTKTIKKNAVSRKMRPPLPRPFLSTFLSGP